jgi:ATP-binding cassette, subfamily B, bacterial
MSRFRNKILEFLKLTFSFRKAVTFVWDSSPKWVIINVVLLVIQGVLPIISLYMMKLMVDSVSLALSKPPEMRTIQPVIQIVVLSGVVALVSALVAQVGESVTRIQGYTLIDYMNNILQEKGIEMDLEYYENADYQDTLHRAQREASYRPLSILNGLAQIAQSGISLIGVAWLLVSFHWAILPILLIAVLPNIAVRALYSNHQFLLDRQLTAKERHSWYYHWIIISTDFAKEVRILGLGSTIRGRYQSLREQIRQMKVNAEVRNSILASISQVISVVFIFGLYVVIVYQTLRGMATLGDMVMYFQAFQRGEGFLRSFLGGFVRLYENNLFLTNLFEFLNLEKRVIEPEHPRLLPNPLSKGIVFENVSFSYPNNHRPILKNINLEVHPGEVIALVGENGSGKTTLVKLLCRLYDPDQGQIAIDGINIKDVTSGDLRSQLGVIFQDYTHYNLTVSDNIWFGDVHQSQDDQLVIDAARLAEAHPFIERLPNGYQTVLGNMFQNGQELSIGQWQKIALARAFFRESQIMILDEPTSALDPQSEYELFLKFRELLNGRTAILISHRLSTVRMANRIYVIRGGEIIEQGTHTELLHLAGTYAQLFEQQAQNYR